MLNDITPVILTYNEAPNIGRTLERLCWARDIVVVDSGSTDSTREVLRRQNQLRVFERSFTTHAEQWNFALQATGISTDWVLALDADFLLPYDLISELAALAPASDIAGYRARFRYCIYGRPLRAAAYPPITVLFRRAGARYFQDGHTQRIQLSGGHVLPLKARIYHDDRKPLSRWLSAQARYMRLEAEKLHSVPLRALSTSDKLRRVVFLAPAAMFFYCLILRGGLLDGWAGLFYALQRATAEMILSIYLVQYALRQRDTV